jgi:hypothetical protein
MGLVEELLESYWNDLWRGMTVLVAPLRDVGMVWG